MAKADSARTTSRRDFLGHVAGAYFAAGTFALGAAAADPVFAAITAHREVNDRFMAALDEQTAFEEARSKPGGIPPAMEAKVNALCDADLESRYAVLTTAPTTKKGMLAYIDHLESAMCFDGTSVEPYECDAILKSVRAFAYTLKG